MNKDEIDTMWQQAMRESIKNNEMYTRYHFAKLVAEAEREACAKLCDDLPVPPHVSSDDATVWDVATLECGDAIRARGQA
jgi:hypothetical protein